MIQHEEIINESMIQLDLQAASKQDVILKLVELMDQAGKLSSKEEFIESVMQREDLLSTYCGSSVAIPHGISEAVIEPGICFARVKTMSWSMPEELVEFVFLLAVPKTKDQQNSPHLELLSAIAVSSLEESNREIWQKAKTKREILDSLILTMNQSRQK